MSADPASAATRRFARDLRRIREDRDVTVAEVHEATQNSEAQVEAFERGALFEKSTMNRVYLRAFVRSYAESIAISPDEVADHLDAALDGAYENDLAVEYLDGPPSLAEDVADSDAGADSTDTPSDERAETSRDPADAEGDGQTGDGEFSAGVDIPRDSVEEEESAGSSAGLGAVPGAEGEAGTETDRPTPGASQEESPSANRSHDSATGAGRGQALDGLFSGRLFRGYGSLLGGVISVVAFGVLVGIGVTYFGGSESTPETAVGSGTGADTVISAQEAAPAPPRDRPDANVTVGDTLHVTIAAAGPIREMRVQQDDDLRRPYWIEEGEASVFPFTERLVLEDQLDSARVFLEGYPYPTSARDSLGRIVIDRGVAEAFVDTLTGEPRRFDPSPDTVEIRNWATEGE